MINIKKKKHPQDFIGIKFKNVEIIAYSTYIKGHHHVDCRCKCGTIIKNKRYNDITDDTKCENCRTTRYKTNKEKHLYKIFKGIRDRCYNKNNKEYHVYGGKGIKICNEWLNDRMNFVQWSLENGYKDGLSIDRIDSNKDYCPENCRWITRSLNSTLANNSRKYKLDKAVIATSPSGEEFLLEYDLKRFCDARDLDVSSARKVLRGEYKQHKGWIFKYK